MKWLFKKEFNRFEIAVFAGLWFMEDRLKPWQIIGIMLLAIVYSVLIARIFKVDES